MIRSDDADRNDVFGGDDHGIGGHRHDGIEVARGQRIGKVAEIIGQEGMDKGEVRAEGRLQQKRLAIDVEAPLAFLDDGADAGRREHAAEAATAGTDALDQGALRHQVDRDLLGHHLLLHLRIEADVAGSQGGYERGVEQLSDPLARCGRIVADQRKLGFLLSHQLVEQPLRRPDAHESADHHRRAVGNHCDGFLGRDGSHVGHSGHCAKRAAGAIVMGEAGTATATSP
jgi:hypothetical protein